MSSCHREILLRLYRCFHHIWSLIYCSLYDSLQNNKLCPRFHSFLGPAVGVVIGVGQEMTSCQACSHIIRGWIVKQIPLVPKTSLSSFLFELSSCFDAEWSCIHSAHRYKQALHVFNLYSWQQVCCQRLNYFFPAQDKQSACLRPRHHLKQHGVRCFLPYFLLWESEEKEKNR